ncbi:MAG: histidinol-phosphatase [Clostridia bacterium]|nr:histidinol-phosphatase [Clostridia bacterium]
MDYSYHNHTFRCHHASGTPEEYIKRAVENGVKYMGFSEHLPYICRDGFEAGYRLSVADVNDYFEEMYELREKYKDVIDLKIGFEMECYPELFDGMLKSAIDYGAEYLILGQHFLVEEHPDGIYITQGQETEESMIRYADCVIFAIRSGVFSYVAHPDAFKFTGDKDIYDREMQRLCQAAKDCSVPLEINFLGIRENRIYPNENFWKIAGQVGAPVTFGFDAHDSKNAYDTQSFEKAYDLIEKYNLNYIGKPEIIILNR